MNLNVSKWKPFITARLFPVLENGKANQQKLDEGNDCFYVGAKRDDNGVMIHCMRDESLITKGNCIVFICNGQGSVGYANYMDVDFLGTTDIVAGYNEFLNPFTGAFLASVYSQERPKYSFGRKWKTHLKETEVDLPVKHNSDGTIFIDETHRFSDAGYVPDWQFMEEYIKSLHHKQLTTKNKPGQSPDLNVQNWKEFTVPELFGNVKIAKSADIGNLEEGNTPFIGRTDVDNGVQGFVDPMSITKGKCITISMVGTNVALYQEEDFQASQNIAILRKDRMTKPMALFICSVINFEMRLKYSYGRTVGKTNIEQMILKLPVDSEGNPDWQFMEDYIKALPYGDRLED